MEKEKEQKVVNPPWVEFSNIEPESSFWRQGTGEAWICDVWLPYWYQLTSLERREYLEKFPPSTESWSMFIENQLELIAKGRIKEANI